MVQLKISRGSIPHLRDTEELGSRSAARVEALTLVGGLIGSTPTISRFG